MTRLALLGASLLLLAAPAFAAPPALSPAASESYQKLVAAMRAEIASPKAKSEGLQEKKDLLADLSQSRDQPDSLDRAILRVGTTYSSDSTRAASEKLRTLLADESAARLAASLHVLQDRLQRVKDAIVAAKTAADLDAAAADLATLPLRQNSTYGLSQEESELIARLVSAKRFVNLWQDYLFAKSIGDSPVANRTLNILISLPAEESPIPRSQLMEIRASRTVSDDDAVRLVSEIKSLDEMREILVGLRAGSDEDYNSLRTPLIRALSSLETAYRRHLSGLPVEIGPYSLSLDVEPGPAAAKLSELKGQLLKLALSRYLGAPTSLTARNDETFNAFLDRVVEDAKSHNDPALAYRARQAKAMLDRTEKLPPADTTGVTAYLAALAQVEAGQFSLAVLSYQQALKSGSDLISPKAIGEQLESLRAAHPDGYRQGTDWFVQSQLPAPSPALPPQPPVIPPAATPPAVVPVPPAEPVPAKPVDDPAPVPAPAEPGPPKDDEETDGQ